MCGRFAQPVDIITVNAQMEEAGIGKTNEVDTKKEMHRRYNFSPTSTTPVYHLVEGEPALQYMRWGVIPKWIGSWDEVKACKLTTFNTRLDNIDGRLWAGCERCIVPVCGYYEWKQKGMPYYVSPKSKVNAHAPGDEWPLLLLGGVCSLTHVDGKPVRSFSIVTTEADNTLEWLHHRMPLMVSPKDVDLWLSGGKVEPATDNLQWYKVDPTVGNTKLDNENFIKPLKARTLDTFLTNKPAHKQEHKTGPHRGVKREIEDCTEDRKVKKEHPESVSTREKD